MVIVTPYRRLRDAILQAPDFLGSIFQGTDYGPRVSWLGRPSDGPGSFCSWEDKVAGIVEEKLTYQRNKARAVEKDDLLPAYKKIEKMNIQWASLPAAGKHVIPTDMFKALQVFRELSRSYMALIVSIKRQRAVEWDKVIEDNKKAFLSCRRWMSSSNGEQARSKAMQTDYFVDFRSVSSVRVLRPATSGGSIGKHSSSNPSHGRR